jgi:phosphoribosylaminoimidazole-succinocarboxamide synthase
MPKRWSTKSPEILRPATPDQPGLGIFQFTDYYSVFHYGRMPDLIPDKGQALCRMSVLNFHLLEQAGIRTHFRRFLPPDRIEFDLLRILDPGKGELVVGDSTRLVPLQVIFRNQLPPGASVFRRLKSGSVTLDQLGLKHLPIPGERLERPIIEFTTKLEEIDRFIPEEEARSLGCLRPEQMEEIKTLTLRVNELISRKAELAGFEHADGKIEFGIDEKGKLLLVDNCGTTDENRLLYNGQHVGKQLMRDYYHESGLEAQVQRWAADELPRDQWKKPGRLSSELISPLADMYRSACEAWTSEIVWGAPCLAEAIETAHRVLHQEKLFCMSAEREN